MNAGNRRLRVAAFLLDVMLATALASILAAAVGLDVPQRLFALVMILLLYVIVSDLFYGGDTIGKYLLGFWHEPATTEGRILRFITKFGRPLSPENLRGNGPAPFRHDHVSGIRFVSYVVDPIPWGDWMVKVKGAGTSFSHALSSYPRFRDEAYIRIGRSPEWADIPIPDSEASRKHCALIADGGKLFLRNHESMHGTVVDGNFLPNPEDYQQVRDGSRIQIADHVIEIRALYGQDETDTTSGPPGHQVTRRKRRQTRRRDDRRAS